LPQIEFTTEGASTVLEELISEFKDLMEDRIFAQNSGGTKLEKAVKKWHILTNRDIVLVNKLVHN
jgi:hypothetical protein